MKFRALWSQPSTSRVFFKTFFDFSKMDILKMSKIENQFTFWNSSCQDTKIPKNIILKLKPLMVINLKNTKNQLFKLKDGDNLQ